MTEALKMTEGERENVRRIAIRLEQGATAANCDKICRALKVILCKCHHLVRTETVSPSEATPSATSDQVTHLLTLCHVCC